MSYPTILELHAKGLQMAIDEHAEHEQLKLNTLRGGSSGMLSPDGTPLGPDASCPRRALLRAIGINIKPTEVRDQILFDGGLANEIKFYERVAAAWAEYGGEVLSEEECPTTWYTSNGTKVTGRPDGVLVLTKDGTPVRGSELKGVFSLWRARDVMEGKPKFEHMLQSTHYMWQLGLASYELTYVSRSIYVTNDMANRYMPQYGAKLSENINYYYYQWRPKKRGDGLTKARITEEEYLAGLPNNRKLDVPRSKWPEWEFQAVPASIKPMCVSFDMRIVDGAVEYRQLPDSAWTKTVITIDGIRQYYEATADLLVGPPGAKLPPEPTNVDVDGSRKNYGSCNYCPLASKCPTIKTKQELIKAAEELADK